MKKIALLVFNIVLTYTDYLSKCALKIKHVDNVSALTPEVNSGQAIVNI